MGGGVAERGGAGSAGMSGTSRGGGSRRRKWLKKPESLFAERCSSRPSAGLWPSSSMTERRSHGHGDVTLRSMFIFTRRFASSASARLAAVSTDDVAHFARILPPAAVLSSLPPVGLPPADLVPYNADWLGKYTGAASTVLRPRSTQQVSDILKWCHTRRIPVVPQGGNTGLVGGSVPLGGELILSLSSMNNVRSFDPVSGILVADAGCILQSLTDHIAPHNHIMPLDLGAKGRSVSVLQSRNVSLPEP